MNASGDRKSILLIAIGNYGRSDDALGWRFADSMQSFSDCMDITYRYQLQIEDADLASQYQTVIFVDAHRGELPAGYSFSQVLPMNNHTFTTHALLPETILWLANELYDATPNGYVLGIEGMEWELHNGLSTRASHNLSHALEFFTSELQYLLVEKV
jgi:hydrogenase maturation protease